MQESLVVGGLAEGGYVYVWGRGGGGGERANDGGRMKETNQKKHG